MSIVNKIEAALQEQKAKNRVFWKGFRMNSTELKDLKELEAKTGLGSAKVIRFAIQELKNNLNNNNNNNDN